MAKSDHAIELDEKSQEQPNTKDRAADPSSKHQTKPDLGAESGKYPPHQRKAPASSDKT